jgi:hypothetical protein
MRRRVLAYSVRNRKRKAELISRFMAANGVADVVFVGCSGGVNPNEMIVERAIADRAKVLAACDIYEIEGLPWPFVKADGRDLPFPDRYTDMILANAVIEHVGGLADQVRFVAEQTRVARTWVITTPNRWFPIESHTSTPLRHWSRKWRARHEREFTRLLSFSEFRDLLPAGTVIHGRPWSATFTAMYAH